ncbi:MAG TPA: universal stress protein [Candidatus Sulfobium mesophilum]|nr:universal stress protein [Candidatus Sulfobium mesophilum]
MNKILIAIDESQCSRSAVEYIGRQFSGNREIMITLLHVLPYPPAPFWDDGHILSDEEKSARNRVLEKWLINRRAQLEPLFRKAAEVLIEKGIGPEQIEKKSISDSSDVAESILEEVRDGGYQTLVLGRCGLSASKRFLMGSVTTKIVNHGSGIAICIVE